MAFTRVYRSLLVAALGATICTPARAVECVVATVNPLATDAALDAFEHGGNAIDAAIAAALTLGVVDNHNSGLGGGCFILLRLADGTLAAIDGREMAPAAATRDMFLRNGKAVGRLSQTGPLASGVPGALAAYELALAKFGKLTIRDLLLPAAKIADEGFIVDPVYARRLGGAVNQIKQFPATAAILLKPDGTPFRAGERLRQPDLGQSYQAIAKQGADWFYHGEFARRVDRWMADNDGILTADDFANYRAKEREPIVTSYRGFDVVGFPPPSSGGVHVAQILNILENFDLADVQQSDPQRARHLVVEAMKLAFADRAHWLGDADFVDVPRGLIDQGYAQRLAQRIDPTRATDVPSHGLPPGAAEDLFGRFADDALSPSPNASPADRGGERVEKHTTHIAAADSVGNWVAITATVNTTFGSKVIVPGTGIVLNNEMDDFSAQPGVPNAFGLLGAENNAVAPGKRPLSSMSPTIVLKDNEPVMTIGAAGGPKIITQVVLALIRTLDYGQSLADAVAGPRYHHQWRPDSVLLEAKASKAAAAGLKDYGHKVVTTSSSGITQAIGVDDHGNLVGVHDPRVPGKAGRVVRRVRSAAAGR